MDERPFITRRHGWTPRRSYPVAFATLAAWMVIAAALYWRHANAAPGYRLDGSCDGLGFGCTPNPRDGLVILAIFLGPPAAAIVSLTGWAVIHRIHRLDRRFHAAAGVWIGTLGFSAGALICVLLAVITGLWSTRV